MEILHTIGSGILFIFTRLLVIAVALLLALVALAILVETKGRP